MISKAGAFAVIFLPAAFVLIFGAALIQQKNLETGAEQGEMTLKTQWRSAAVWLKGGADAADFRRLEKATGLKTALVGRDGRVIFDAGEQGEPDASGAVSIRAGAVRYAAELPDGRLLSVSRPAERTGDLFSVILELGLLAALAAAFAFLAAGRLTPAPAELNLAVEAARRGGVDLPSFGNEPLDAALYALSSAARTLGLTERRNEELSDRLEFVLGNISEGIILFDGDRIIYHNPRAEEILNFKIPAAASLADRAESINILYALASGRTSELRLGGRTVAVARAESGSVRLALLRDISDREKYSGYKSELVGNLSHELKTPLALIMTAAEVLINDRETPRPFREKFLNVIHKNAKRLNSLLADLIFLHRLESSAGAEPAETDLREVLAEIQDLTDPGGKTIFYDFDAGRAGVRSAHLISVLTNLIGNAVKYSAGAAVRATVRRQGAALEIEVADEGPEIPAGERERIFERFYSLSESRNRAGSGSGLGLAIVKHIARQYNGRAEVSGNERAGNTFRVRLVETESAHKIPS